MLTSACTTPLFPPEAMEGFDPGLQMGIFNAEADVYFKSAVAQVGGRIVATETRSDGVWITAAELPLKDRFTRVVETAKSDGRFIFFYPGPLEADALQRGNKFIMVGVVEGTQRITVDGIQRTVPYLVARCLHVWKTGPYTIADYPYLPDGYYPLEEATYCATSPRRTPSPP